MEWQDVNSGFVLAGIEWQLVSTHDNINFSAEMKVLMADMPAFAICSQEP
jgi:hypothetical protein